MDFITKYLVIVKEYIVPFFHQSYTKLISVESDFVVFISGFSKTLGIEKSLVINAHGAMTLTIILD
ncbi:hypothetical protein ACFLSU_09480 [Bacteroidota bacterium]